MLATGHRLQTLSLIKISNITKNDSGYEIKVPDIIKSTRPGATQPFFSFRFFDENENLCVSRHLEQYLSLTQHIREGIDELLITIKRPIKAAKKDTLSRWIRSTLVVCNIDDKFTPQSVRHAATSAAYKKGMKLCNIKSIAGWSKNSQTFLKYYNRPVVNEDRSFISLFCNS